MRDRAAEIDAFLHSAGWSMAERVPLAGDLSSRKYLRLFKGSETAILMDADTPMTSFRNLTRFLATQGFSVPNIVAEHAEDGLILLEDFGDISLTKHLENGADHAEIDALSVDLLLALRATSAPQLASPDASTLVEWTRLADQHYPGTEAEGLAAFREVLHACLSEALQSPMTLSLRDFHADNLMWLSERSGTARLGLLDYQDAFLTHPCYDLMSYLTDARTEVMPQRREKTLSLYIARSGDDADTFRKAFAAFSAQRNLRILGIFAKSASIGKGHHLPKLPRVYRYLAEALEHDVFKDVRDETIAALPDPELVQKAFA